MLLSYVLSEIHTRFGFDNVQFAALWFWFGIAFGFATLEALENMDVFVRPLDEHVLTPYVYPETWKESDIERQALTVFCTLILGGALLYFFVGGFAYVFLFDREIRKHQFFMPNQELVEIKYAMIAIPWIAVYSTPIFVAELRGHSKLYDNIEERGYPYLIASVLLFMAWNDFAVYWVHRALHHPILYKRVHKVHHLFKVVCF